MDIENPKSTHLLQAPVHTTSHPNEKSDPRGEKVIYPLFKTFQRGMCFFREHENKSITEIVSCDAHSLEQKSLVRER